MTGVDDSWMEPTPEDPPKRKQRDSWGVRREVKRLVPYVGHLIMAVLLFLTAKLADNAQDTADSAAQKGRDGAKLAKETKVEAQAGYAVTAEKVDATGETLAQLAAELKALRADVDALKARAGRPRTRKPAIKVPETVTQPLPPTPAAAAAVAPKE